MSLRNIYSLAPLLYEALGEEELITVAKDFFFFFFTVANYPLVLSLFLPLSLCRQSSVRYMMFRLHDTSEFQSPGRCPRLSSFPLSHCLSIQANVGNAASPL